MSVFVEEAAQHSVHLPYMLNAGMPEVHSFHPYHGTDGTILQ
jgi:hypothetical protein